MVIWLSEAELLAQVGIDQAEFRFLAEAFREQMRYLVRQEGGVVTYNPDAVAMLRGLATMIAQGASPEQIKGWFGLAATRALPDGDEKPAE